MCFLWILKEMLKWALNSDAIQIWALKWEQFSPLKWQNYLKSPLKGCHVIPQVNRRNKLPFQPKYSYSRTLIIQTPIIQKNDNPNVSHRVIILMKIAFRKHGAILPNFYEHCIWLRPLHVPLRQYFIHTYIYVTPTWFKKKNKKNK